MRDEWLVLDLCGGGHRDPDPRAPFGSSISGDRSQLKGTDKNAAWRRQNELERHAGNPRSRLLRGQGGLWVFRRGGWGERG